MQTYATPFSALRFIWKGFLLALVCWMGAVQGWGQSESLVVSGNLKHEETKQRLDNVTVSVLQNGEAFDEIQVDRNGKYFLDLPLRNDYVIVFQAEGMIAKRVAINSAQTPENELTDGSIFDLDMSLFDAIEGFDESITETPIGIASFDERSGRIQFDLDHTNDMRRRIDDELDRLADLADDLERARMRYDNAMEDAARAASSMALSYRIRARSRSSAKSANRSNSSSMRRRMSLVWSKSNWMRPLRSSNDAMPMGVSVMLSSNPSIASNSDMSRSKMEPSVNSFSGVWALLMATRLAIIPSA